MFARLSRGELPGDLFGTPVTVALVADEDSFDDVWTPRLYAAGADFDHIRHIESEDGWAVDLSEDRDKLKLAASLENVRVLYLDALLDNLGVGVDDWRNKQVRRALQPVRTLAAEFSIAALGSMHPNKRADTFRQLVSGTSAFNAVSRSSLLLAEHPDDEQRRVLVRGKGNLSMAPRAIEFEIGSVGFTHHGDQFNAPHANDFGESDLTVDDLIAVTTPMRPAGEARTTARELIAHALADGQWHEAAPIFTTCNEQGINDRAARRAAEDIGIDRDRRGFPSTSWWRLAHTGHTTPSETAVRSGLSVRCAETVTERTPDTTDNTNTFQFTTPDTPDAPDSENTQRNGVRCARDGDTTPQGSSPSQPKSDDTTDRTLTTKDNPAPTTNPLIADVQSHTDIAHSDANEPLGIHIADPEDELQRITAKFGSGVAA
jgi:hypothetical protein